jgi:hypothetical protein
MAPILLFKPGCLDNQWPFRMDFDYWRQTLPEVCLRIPVGLYTWVCDAGMVKLQIKDKDNIALILLILTIEHS